MDRFFENTSLASENGGEMIFVNVNSQMPSILDKLSPAKYLLSSIKRLFSSFKNFTKNKTVMIQVSALVLIWLILIILQTIGVKGKFMGVLNFLTYAQGGNAKGLLSILGGTVGKGIVSYFVFSSILPLFQRKKTLKGIRSGFSSIASLFKVKNIQDLGFPLIGVGLSLIAYNFMNGTSSLQNSMVGIAAFFISLKALSRSIGFLRGFISSILYKFGKKKNIEVGLINKIIAGLTLGFALAVVISAINISFICYALGLVLFISGVIILTIKKNEEKAVA